MILEYTSRTKQTHFIECVSCFIKPLENEAHVIIAYRQNQISEEKSDHAINVVVNDKVQYDHIMMRAK